MFARSPDHHGAICKPTQPSDAEPENHHVTGDTHAHPSHFSDDLEVRHLHGSRAVKLPKGQENPLLPEREQEAGRTPDLPMRMLYRYEYRPLSFLTVEIRVNRGSDASTADAISHSARFASSVPSTGRALRGKGLDRDGDFRQLAKHSVRVGTALGFVLHLAARFLPRVEGGVFSRRVASATARRPSGSPDHSAPSP